MLLRIHLSILISLLLPLLSPIPVCEVSTPQDKLILLQSENMEIAYSSYIKGFNLSYQKLSAEVGGSVSLHDPLKVVHVDKLYCRGVFTSEPKILVSNVQSERGGRWLGEIFVLLADEKDFCLSIGKIHSEGVDFFNYQALLRIDIDECYSTNKISSGDWVIHCKDPKGQILYYYKSGKMRTKRFELAEPVIKSTIYNDIVEEREVWRLIVLTETFLRIYKLDNVISELTTLDAKYFGVESVNLTDFFISERLVVSDYTQGIARMDLINDTVSNVQLTSSNGSVILKIAGIGTTYFLLSQHEIFEVVWMESAPSVNVYMIEGDIEDVSALSANHQIIIIQSKEYDYIHKRRETSSTYLLEKKRNEILSISLLNPQSNRMLEIDTREVTTKEIGEGYISIQNLSSDIKFEFVATSMDEMELKCKVEISLELCTDLNKIYTIDTLDSEFRISANTTLLIPIGDFFTGLNLAYQAVNTPEITYQFRTKDPLKLFSAYANFEVLELLSIDGLTFYKISREGNTYYTQICSQSNLVCQPICHRTIDGEVVSFKIFKVSSNSYFNNLITYTLKNQTNTIYIQRLNINKTVFTFPTFTIPLRPYQQIYDYTLSNQYIFVIHKSLNIVNVYELDFKQYPCVQTITNRIFKNKLFKPREVRILPLVSRNLYIKTVDSIAILDFSPKTIRVLSIIDANITLREYWDKWDFQSNSMMINIISIFENRISEYSIIQPESPMFLKDLPLLDFEIVEPITSYLSPTNQLFINTKSSKGYFQFTVFRVGEPSIDSLFFSFYIDIQDGVSNVKGLRLQQDDLILIYQNTSYHVWTQRIQPSVILSLSTTVPMNQFITTIPMTISITSPNDTLPINNLLKIINYQQKISTLSYNQPITLPTMAHNYVLSFDQSYWFKGSIVRMDLILDGSWSDKVELVHQFDKKEKDESIRNSLDILEENGIIWILTVNRTIIALNQDLTPARKMIIGLSSNCKRFAKSPKLILVFCETASKEKYITPISLPGSDVYNIGSDIYYRNWVPKNILKARIVQDWLLILDNDIFGEGEGSVYVYKVNMLKKSDSLTEISWFTAYFFGFTEPNSTLNDFEVVMIKNGSYQIYLTINIFGLVTNLLQNIPTNENTWTKIDLLNDFPAYMKNYEIDGNEILQIRIIDSYETFDESSKYHHIAIITTKTGAHLQIQLNYLNISSSVFQNFISSELIQAFNTYFHQTRLNWLIAPPYDSSRENLFLTGYFNDTIDNSTIVIYRLVTSRPQQNIKQFPIFKEGIMFDCSNPADIAYALFVVDKTIRFSWIPICNDVFQIKNYSLLVYHLSNNISLRLNYNTPPTKLTELRFHALNDYSDATYNLAVKIFPSDQMKWWQILIICSSVILVFVMIFCIIRQLRISKQVQNKKLFNERLANLITDSTHQVEEKQKGRTKLKEIKFVVIKNEDNDESDSEDDEWEKEQKQIRREKRSQSQKQGEKGRGEEKGNLESDDFIDVSMEGVQCNNEEFQDILEKTEDID